MKIGIIGGGQLAQMLALAGHPLGLKTVCLEPTNDCPASLVTEVMVGSYDDVNKLQQLADRVDVLTYEFENISAAALAHIHNMHTADTQRNRGIALYPPAPALAISQDRLQEKKFFEQLHIPTTHYAAVNSLEELQQAISRIGIPAVLKTRRLGYDGKGQYIIDHAEDVETAWQTLQNQPLLLENKIPFEREVSCIGVRNSQGEIVFYPLTENQHRQGILRMSTVITDHSPMEDLARQYVGKILQELNYVGVLAVEFFQRGDQLIANEMAPRVHNSGHWTIEGAEISQFENHLRAVCGLPLGSTTPRKHVAMFNIIGDIPSVEALLNIPHAHCHFYGKAPRPGRKLGHVTVCSDDSKTFGDTLQKLSALLK